ncbi:uncharacterized protein LTR77_000797 [Saxophila tyrrhenica]|uniref:UBC core domain-containing protein n=1 Tax=Saxophila tyrrhenica TaxID=1690608 RepID=A0AAV9PTL0_9PEZI|nr:hypothetical protein LTR77_000797 [Saxophila tyrrhenica]
MSTLGPAYTKQKLCLDFASLKHAFPKGIYVAPLPDDPLIWAGLLFVRKGRSPYPILGYSITDAHISIAGPYANAVLRFHVDFPDAYPALPPIVTILNDVFHPLVTPLTTYSYSTRDTGAETASAADDDRLPPGGLSLRHGFPQWFGGMREGGDNKGADSTRRGEEEHNAAAESNHSEGVRHPPHIIEVLQYLRIVFSTEALLDSVPLEAAANTGAWHAWRSHRAKVHGRKDSRSSPGGGSRTPTERSMSPRQQPGGARKPGEWNWQGVWEDRVRKSVQASISESALYGGEGDDVLCFSKMDAEGVGEVLTSLRDGS